MSADLTGYPFNPATDNNSVEGAKVYVPFDGNRMTVFRVTTPFDSAATLFAHEEGVSVEMTSVNDATDVITITTPTFSNGDRVFVTGATITGGLTEGDVYYVISVSGSNLQLSLTSGGAAIDLTDTNTCVIYQLPASQNTGDMLLLKLEKSDGSDRTLTFKGGFNPDDGTKDALTASATHMYFVYDSTSGLYNRVKTS